MQITKKRKKKQFMHCWNLDNPLLARAENSRDTNLPFYSKSGQADTVDDTHGRVGFFV